MTKSENAPRCCAKRASTESQPDPRTVWESLTPAQRDLLALLSGVPAFVRAESRPHVYALRLALLAEESAVASDFWRRTDLGRAVAAAGAEVDRG